MKFFIKVLGFMLAKTPECVLRGICCLAARFIDVFMPSRMRIANSNLKHCFPALSDAEIRAISLESARRMVEMGLFVLASPHIKLSSLRERIKVDDYLLGELSKRVEDPKPTIIVIPHFCMMESITLLPALVDAKLPPVGVFYRPFDNPSIESWVLESRQRCGIKLLSRRKGTRVALDFLRQNGCVALLFDQHAGAAGSLGIFFDRLCSTTELPRILAEHQKADIAVFYARRTGFWRAEISGEWLEYESTDGISEAMNKWLQGKLETDAGLCKDWLWLHKRWERNHIFGMPKFKEGELEKCLRQAGGKFKRVCSVAVAAPASLRGTFALAPILRAIKKGRDDATVSLICERRFYDTLSKFDFADEIICAPDYSSPIARLRFMRSLKPRYIDVLAVMEDSFLSDLGARLLAPTIALAIQSKRGRKRRFMNAFYAADYASEADSLTSYYENLFRTFGLKGELDFSPLAEPRQPDKNLIGIVCGGAGNHAMSAEKWGQIIKKLDTKLDEAKFVVLGDDEDSRTAAEITKTAEYADIKALAGGLSDDELIGALRKCSLVIGTDCRLTHIANALGIAVVAVYGQTNPLRNGLVFEAPKAIVRPRNSPPQGGVPVEGVEAADVASEALSLINK